MAADFRRDPLWSSTPRAPLLGSLYRHLSCTWSEIMPRSLANIASPMRSLILEHARSHPVFSYLGQQDFVKTEEATFSKSTIPAYYKTTLPLIQFVQTDIPDDRRWQEGKKCKTLLCLRESGCSMKALAILLHPELALGNGCRVGVGENRQTVSFRSTIAACYKSHSSYVTDCTKWCSV